MHVKPTIVFLLLGAIYFNCSTKTTASTSGSLQKIIRVVGQVDAEHYFGITKGKSSGDFEIAISADGKCYIAYAPGLEPEMADSPVTLWEYYFDGTDSYTRSSFDPSFSPNQIIARPTDGKLLPIAPERKMMMSHHANLTVHEGETPTYNNDILLLTWIAYHLKNSLESQVELQYKPFFYMGPAYSAHNIKLATHIDWNNNALSSLVQLHPPERLLLNRTNGYINRTPLETVSGQEYTNLNVKVHSWTNVSELTFPSELVAQVWLPVPPELKVSLVKKFKLKATNVAVEVGVEELPTLEPIPKTRVTESRSRVSGVKVPYIYQSDSGAILAKNELMGLENYNSFVSNLRKDEIVAGNVVWVRIAIAAIILCTIPVGLYILNKAKRKNI